MIRCLPVLVFAVVLGECGPEPGPVSPMPFFLATILLLSDIREIEKSVIGARRGLQAEATAIAAIAPHVNTLRV